MRFSAFTVAATVVAGLVSAQYAHQDDLHTSSTRKYSTVTGYFLQDDAGTDPSTFDPTTTNFGLKPIANKTAGQTDWQAFASQVAALNAAADSSTSYKVLFMARHGEGWHNVAQEYYGTIEWGAYWCEKDGNGTVTWFDRHLTSRGVQQAQNLSAAWQHQLDVAKTPAPQSYYVSPLDRTCATGNLTFSTLKLPEGATPYVPTVKEKLRETLGVATCDERSNKTYIAGQFPTYKFEDGFTEDDELWKPYWLEPPWQQDERMGQLLDDVFTNDKNPFISFTSHTGSIASLLRVLGHRSFALSTAGLLPVLVQSTLE